MSLDDNYHKAYSKEWYAKNADSIREKRRARYWANREELKEAVRLRYHKNKANYIDKAESLKDTPNYQARQAVHAAVLRGALVKQPCEVCNELKTFAHHHLGYEEEHWLDVQWLCNKHHGEVHRVKS